jgi:hypothetical protein
MVHLTDGSDMMLLLMMMMSTIPGDPEHYLSVMLPYYSTFEHKYVY